MVKGNRGVNHPFFKQGKRAIEVIAHRGGAGEWPGETIFAFEEAVKIGVDVLEMDIRYTANDDLVLMHNANLKATTNVDKRVQDLKSKDIQQPDAAYWWRQGDKMPPPGAELTVPRLEDVFRRFRGLRMNIEIKPFSFPIRLIKKFCGLLREYEMIDKVLVASGSPMNLHFFRSVCPEVATSASVLEMAAFRALKNIGYTPNADALQISSRAGPLHFITQDYVDKAHNRGLKVHGWTVNEPEEMGRLISLGVDGIITDYPSTLLKLI
ncbi:MAG: glycerophosphodiester phosphodiesterase [Acidobacteriota bacterium]